MDTMPEAYELRHVDDDSDDSEVDGSEFYKACMELPALEPEQQIGEFESLVLV